MKIIKDTSQQHLIKATETIPEGYQIEFVFNCIINPTGDLPNIEFKMKINVVQEQLDCSESLKETSDFIKIRAYEYDLQKGSVEIAPSYESLFVHAQKKDCHVKTCEIMANENNCGNQYPSQDNFKIGKGPEY